MSMVEGNSKGDKGGNCEGVQKRDRWHQMHVLLNGWGAVIDRSAVLLASGDLPVVYNERQDCATLTKHRYRKVRISGMI